MEPPHAAARPGTRLPHVLAGLYALAIVYASLEPFSPWLPPAPGTRLFLFGAGTRFIRHDALLNALAYLPFGFFVGLLARGASPVRRIATSVLVGAAMSFAMESLQMYIPPRIASPYDLAANLLGALAGGVLATLIAAHAGARDVLYQARAGLFLPGYLGDVGLGLLLLWLVAQANPGIPLFGLTFEDDGIATVGASVVAVAAPHDSAGAVLQAAGSAFQILGVGLFAALLLRRHVRVVPIVLGMIAGALLVKVAAAALVLKPAIWQAWLKPDTIAGIAAGVAALAGALLLPRPAQVALCAIALLSSLGTPMLVPETLSGRPPTALFDWHYGQLLNYNGLTRTALLLWPVMSAAWLFALAGRPAWGRPAETT